jgi:hypothetical protein
MHSEIIRIIGICILSIPVLYTLYGIPAILTLPSGVRSGIDDLTIEQAVDTLKSKNIAGVVLIQEARRMVATRMQYCRRNSYDTYKTAFRRGYGYCVQQAYALQFLLTELGFDAKVVQATRNRFENGKIGGHAWVRVLYNNTLIQIDPTDKNLQNEGLTFEARSKVTEFGYLFRALTFWGSAGFNAHRYYITGRDDM